MGGEISKLRPPAPGYDKPYPYLNNTPRTNPEFPSAEARQALTDHLEEERETAQRLSLSTGKMPDSASFSPSPKSDKPSPTSPNTHPADTTQTGEVQVIYLPIDHPFPATLPQVTAPPALPISFPGFQIPSPHEALRPHFEITPPLGSLIRFEEESDHLIAGQENTLQDIIHNRHKKTILLKSFGTTVNDQEGLDPEEQNHALTLALLRARLLAHYFIQHHVPMQAIVIQAQAVGDGVRILLQ